MKFIIKLFPEIITKSTSVRARFIKILDTNVRNIIKPVDPSLAVIRYWDHIEVRTKHNTYSSHLPDALTRIPGIHHVLEVEAYYYQEMQDIFLHSLKIYQKILVNKTFRVRVKRRGQHSFTSMEIERYLGQALCENIPGARVNLTQPEVTVALELQHNELRLIKARYEGLGGFPTGTQEPVLSLISGGFDSSVASYMLMRRGCKVHFCFFNLGGEAHEIGVQRLAYHLWKRFSSSHQVRFISIDFLPVLNEILQKIEEGQRGVVLKRMMIRVASQIARRYGIGALVTGEALGQVASQTLSNLNMIDSVTDTLILRPLIAHDKEQIIQLARVIGTEPLAKEIPEYCGVISKNPTVKAQPEKIKEEESRFDFFILDKVIQEAKKSDIRTLSERKIKKNTAPLEIVATTDKFSDKDVLLDIRTPDEQKENPLHLQRVQIKSLPFYQLSQKFSSLDQSKTYFLYCDRGVMSRLQALYLRDQGMENVKIYQP